VRISGMNPSEDLPDEVRDRAYHAQPVWKRIVVIAAGPAVNLVVALVLLWIFFFAIGPQDVTRHVSAVEKGMPAEKALKPGDTLVAVDGVRGDPARLSKQIQSHHCAGKPHDGCKATTPATLLIKRDGKLMTIRLTPVYDANLQGAKPRTRLGFGFAADGPHVTYPAGKAFTISADQFWFITKQTVSLPARLINPEQRKEISGVVGAYNVTRETILTDLGDAVGILAIISLSLAIVNLFPFLPLDGGHIFWAIVEKVRRKPVPFAVMERAGVVGFMLVILIFLIGLTNDIGRLSGEGFGVR
jgi:regulator of sigma E protease